MSSSTRCRFVGLGMSHSRSLGKGREARPDFGDAHQMHGALSENINCRMLIYDIGGVSASSHEILLDIHVLRTLFPAAALVIFSDNEGFDSIIAALNAGARGYLGNSMPPDLALQALSFLLRGGTYFPPAAIMASRPGGKSAHSGYRRSASEETATGGDLGIKQDCQFGCRVACEVQPQAAISYEKLHSGHTWLSATFRDIF